MSIMQDVGRFVTVGIDTHADVHVAVAVDEQGRRVDRLEFAASAGGHRCLDGWLAGLGVIDRVGVEGTGSWGASLSRHLTRQGRVVVEVNRPDRSVRHRDGKSDPIDAEAAARAVQAGTATAVPKSRVGLVESIRVLRVARTSAVRVRAQTMTQIRSLISTAEPELRDEFHALTAPRLIARLARFRPGDPSDPTQATKRALRSLATRYQHLSVEIRDLDAHLDELVAVAAPELIAKTGIGTDVAGQLLVTAGDNPNRIRSDAAFARICGVAPLPASSGKTRRHRLNRSGDRAANAALYRIVITRLRHDARTQAYMHRRISEGLSKREIIRCLKRYVAREIYTSLNRTAHLTT